MAAAALVSINTSSGGVPKRPRHEARLTFGGLEGDRQRDLRHHGGPDRAVCLYSFERLRELQHEGHDVSIGTLGENLTISGLDWRLCTPGTRIHVGDATLRLTSFAVPCRNLSAYFDGGQVGRVSQKLHPGWSRAYARVEREGQLHLGDEVQLVEDAPAREPARAADAALAPDAAAARTLVRLSGELELAAPLGRVFPLFTPDGERLWVPDFDPEYLHPPCGDVAPGAIFLTRHGGETTLWMVLRLSPDTGVAEYARSTPGSRRGTVHVRARDAGLGTTRVEISYDLTAVSAGGVTRLAAFERDFPSMLRDWQTRLTACLDHDTFD
jgi:MOSC domain-containing protein YiiM